MNKIGTKEYIFDDYSLVRETKKDDIKTFLNGDRTKEICDKATWKYMTLEELENSKEIEYKNDFFCWAIKDNSTGSIIGSISVHHIYDDNTCEIGYNLNPNYWNKGIMTRFYKIILDYLLNEVKFDTVIAKCKIDNIGSEKVMKKSNMIYFDNENQNGQELKCYKKSR